MCLGAQETKVLVRSRVDWRTGVDFQSTGSFTHSVKLLSCPWRRDPLGDPEYSFVEKEKNPWMFRFRALLRKQW
jgi:hypothetical protein